MIFCLIQFGFETNSTLIRLVEAEVWDLVSLWHFYFLVFAADLGEVKQDAVTEADLEPEPGGGSWSSGWGSFPCIVSELGGGGGMRKWRLLMRDCARAGISVWFIVDKMILCGFRWAFAFCAVLTHFIVAILCFCD